MTPDVAPGIFNLLFAFLGDPAVPESIRITVAIGAALAAVVVSVLGFFALLFAINAIRGL